jgi:hypothetical protein
MQLNLTVRRSNENQKENAKERPLHRCMGVEQQVMVWQLQMEEGHSYTVSQ